jgi:hypothetical protein
MDARYCGNCGTERLSRSHKYCNSCGRQFAGEADNRIRGISRPNLSRQSRKQIVIVSVASVLGAGVLYWLLQELRPKYNSATQQATSFTKGSDQDGVEATPIPSKTSGYHENSHKYSPESAQRFYIAAMDNDGAGPSARRTHRGFSAHDLRPSAAPITLGEKATPSLCSSMLSSSWVRWGSFK